jgi:hypothetical protein
MRSAAIAIACNPDEHTGHVHPLLSFGHGAAENHVFDLLWIELRHSVECAFNCHRGQFIRACRPQRALEGAANRRANRRDDHGFPHF